MAKKVKTLKTTTDFLAEHERFLSFDQLKEIAKMADAEKPKFITWLSERNYKGTSEEWMVFTNRQQLVNKNIKKINELTDEQRKGIKSLISNEVREYITWLYVEKNYVGGTIDEWQVWRIQEVKRKKEVPVTVEDNVAGRRVIRIKK